MQDNDDERSFGIKDLLSNWVYMLLVMSIASLYFVLSGLQFWATAYLNEVMGAPLSQVFTYFVIICLTAPTLGILTSIVLFNCIGGYTSKYALSLLLLFSALTVLACLPVPVTVTASATYGLIWLIFFFISAMLAPLIGIMLSQVP